MATYIGDCSSNGSCASSDESSTASAQDFQPECSSLQLEDCDSVAAVQRRRRMRRVQIMQEKRNRSRNGHGLPTLNLLPLPRSSSGSYHSSANIDDPKVLRKLKNRESAARSRQRKDEMLDGLTYQLCEYYVTLADLQSEQQQLVSMLSPLATWTPEANPFAPIEFEGMPIATDETDSVSDMTPCSSCCSSPLHSSCSYSPEPTASDASQASIAFWEYSPEDCDVAYVVDSLDW